MADNTPKNIIFVVTFLSLTSPEVFNSGCILELPEEILNIQMQNTQYFVKTHWMMFNIEPGLGTVVSVNARK